MKNSKIIIAAGVFAAAFFAAQSAISSERSKIAHVFDGPNLTTGYMEDALNDGSSEDLASKKKKPKCTSCHSTEPTDP